MKKEKVIKEKRFYYGPNDSGLTFAVCCILPQLLALCLVLILNACGVKEGLGVTLLSCLVGPVCYIIYFVVYNKTQNIGVWSANSFSFKMKWWHPLLAIALSLVCLFGLNDFVTLIDEGLKLVGYEAIGLNLPMDNFGWFVLNVLLLGVLPSICEEFIFRGMIFNGIKEMGTHKAVFLSGALFALFHGNAGQTVYQFLLGVVLGYIVVITGNLLCAIIVHFTNNFTVLLINYINRGKTFEVVLDAKFISLAIVFAVLATAVVGVSIWLILRWQKKKKPITDVEKAQQLILERKVSRQVFLNKLLWIGIIFALTIWIADLIY